MIWVFDDYFDINLNYNLILIILNSYILNYSNDTMLEKSNVNNNK